MATTVEELSLEVERLVRALSTALQTGTSVDSNGNPVPVKVYQSLYSETADTVSSNGVKKTYVNLMNDVVDKISRIEIDPANKDAEGLIFSTKISNYLQNTFAPTIKDQVYNMILGNGDGYQGVIDTFKELQKLIGTEEGAGIQQSLLAQLSSVRAQIEQTIRDLASAKGELRNEFSNGIADVIADTTEAQGKLETEITDLKAQFSGMTSDYSSGIRSVTSKIESTDAKLDASINSVKELLATGLGQRDNRLEGHSAKLSAIQAEFDQIGNAEAFKKAIADLQKVKVGDFWRMISPLP